MRIPELTPDARGGKQLVTKKSSDLVLPQNLDEIRQTVRVLNTLTGNEPTLAVSEGATERGLQTIEFATETPIDSDFYHAQGTLWSAIRSVETARKYKKRTLDDREATITVSGVLRGVNTMQHLSTGFMKKAPLETVLQGIQSATGKFENS